MSSILNDNIHYKATDCFMQYARTVNERNKEGLINNINSHFSRLKVEPPDFVFHLCKLVTKYPYPVNVSRWDRYRICTHLKWSFENTLVCQGVWRVPLFEIKSILYRISVRGLLFNLFIKTKPCRMFSVVSAYTLTCPITFNRNTSFATRVHQDKSSWICTVNSSVSRAKEYGLFMQTRDVNGNQ